MFSFPLGSYGSLYYKGGLPLHLQADLYGPETLDERGDASRFCIGPATDYMFWRGKRAQLDVNRGPCWYSHLACCMLYWLYIYLGREQHEYLRSIGRRETEWTRKFGKA